MLQVRIGLNLTRSLVTIYGRKLDIHEDKVGPMFGRHCDAFCAVICFNQIVSSMGEQISEDAAVVLGVLYDENAFFHASCLCCCTRTGTTMLKVEPTPTVESKSIRPPCIPTSWREIDNPNPVPPFFRVLVLSICWNCSNIVA